MYIWYQIWFFIAFVWFCPPPSRPLRTSGGTGRVGVCLTHCCCCADIEGWKGALGSELAGALWTNGKCWLLVGSSTYVQSSRAANHFYMYGPRTYVLVFFSFTTLVWYNSVSRSTPACDYICDLHEVRSWKLLPSYPCHTVHSSIMQANQSRTGAFFSFLLCVYAIPGIYFMSQQ